MQVWSPLPPLLLHLEKTCPKHGGRGRKEGNKTDHTTDTEREAGEGLSCNCLTATVKLAVEEYHGLIQDFKFMTNSKISTINAPCVLSNSGTVVPQFNNVILISPHVTTTTSIISSSSSSSSATGSSSSATGSSTTTMSGGKLYVVLSTCAVFIVGVSLDSVFLSSKSN